MKKLSIIALLFLSLQFLAKAQQAKLYKSVNVIYDFNSSGIGHRMYQYKRENDSTNVQKVWYGRSIYFDLTLNPYLYDVAVTSRQALDEGINNQNAEFPFLSIQKAIAVFDSGKQQIQSATEVPFSKNSEAVPLSQQKAVQLISESKELNNDIRNNKELPALLAIYNIDTLMRYKNVYSFGVQSFLNKLLRDNEKETNSLIDNADKLLYLNARKDFIKSKIEFDSAVFNLNNYLQTCKYATMLILTDGYDRDTILAKLNTLLDSSINYTIDQFTNFSAGNIPYYKRLLDNSFQNLNEVYYNLALMNDTFSVKQAKLFDYDSSVFKKYDSGYRQINLANVDIVSLSLAHIINELQNKNVFRHRYHVEFAREDSVIFSVRITKSLRFDSLMKVYGIQPKYLDTNFCFPVPVKGGFNLNFSVGMSFLYKSLRKSSYFYESDIANTGDSNDKVFIRKGKQTNRYQPVISAFSHAYLKLGGAFTPAITIGVSANPTDLSNSTFMLGGSVIFGHNSRFIATIGVAGSSVDYLKPKYQVNKEYLTKNFTGVEEKDLTEKTFRAGMFFGFSYNISKK